MPDRALALRQQAAVGHHVGAKAGLLQRFAVAERHLRKRAAETGLVALLLDDLQWSDATSLDLLRHFTRTLRDAPVLIVGTYRRDDIETLRKLAVESRVELFLIGDPIHMSGAPSRQGEYTREFARELEYKTGLPVKFWDERWTSREAERTLRGSGIAHNERKPAIDRLSAVILLQSYLDSAEARG